MNNATLNTDKLHAARTPWPKFWLYLGGVLLTGALLLGCSDDPPLEPGGFPFDTGTGDADADADTDADTDTDSDTDTESDYPTECVDPASDCPAPANSCSQYICVGGLCELDFNNGLACDDVDGNECTSDVCVDGVCTPFDLSGTDCGGSAGSCFGAGTCQDGFCSGNPLGYGVACGDDGNLCTNDVCDGAGTCGVPLSGGSCDVDPTDCVTQICQVGVCQGFDLPDSAPCSDGLWCNGSADSCQTGVCTPLAGAEPCATAQICHDSLCTEPSGTDTVGTCQDVLLTGDSCDDVNFCNGPDVCNNGTCVHGPAPCGAGSTECSLEVCDGSACVMEDLEPGTPCPTQDGFACNGTESCQAGVCVAGSPACPSVEPCRELICTEAPATQDGFECDTDLTDLPDGTACSPSGACESSGARECLSGNCVDGFDPVICKPQSQDENLCTAFNQMCFFGDPQCIAAPGVVLGDEVLACDTTIDFDTRIGLNDVTAYGAPCSGGAFDGGEFSILIDLPENTAYTASMAVTAETSSGSLNLVLVDDPCSPGASCINNDVALISATTPTDASGLKHYILVDGTSTARGIGSVTVTCP